MRIDENRWKPTKIKEIPWNCQIWLKFKAFLSLGVLTFEQLSAMSGLDSILESAGVEASKRQKVGDTVADLIRRYSFCLYLEIVQGM